MQIVKDWYQRHFSDPQVAILALLLVFGFVFVLVSSSILAPVFVAIVMAYLLEGPIQRLERLHMPRLPAVILVFLVFMFLLVALLFMLLPKLSRQLTSLFQELPAMLSQAEALMLTLPEEYPAWFSQEQVVQWVEQIKDEVMHFGQVMLARTVTSVVGIITFVVYVILVPFLIFFMMKDKARILGWLTSYLPRDRGLATTVWQDVDRQIGNYIRGKFWEILIIWAMTWVVFTLFGLNYAVLLSFLVGVSVIIPYVGAVIVTIPIAVIAYFQWGFGSEWVWLIVAYFGIQAVDANVVVPLLFSEVVDLHPIAIIIAILFFGGIWGIWGVFFAIPLATLVSAVLKAWPNKDAIEEYTEASAEGQSASEA